MSMLAELSRAGINRTSPVPFHFQIKKLLADEIGTGRWPPGTRLPSEPAICAHFDVSRSTVRQALAALESAGVIRKEKGRGTFVAEASPAAWLLQSSHGFHDEARRAGHAVTSRVLSRAVGPLPDWAVGALALDGPTTGVVLERLRWVDDQLVMYAVTYLPPWLADVVLPADLRTGSLYRTLAERAGLTLAGGRRVVDAVVADDELAGLLEVEVGAPLLFVESVSWGADLRPFECYRSWHRADRAKIEVQVVAPDVATRAGLDPTTMRITERRPGPAARSGSDDASPWPSGTAALGRAR
jgi:GntR family transcriptional regulator